VAWGGDDGYPLPIDTEVKILAVLLQSFGDQVSVTFCNNGDFYGLITGLSEVADSGGTGLHD
jgi:hypothetical protein